MDWTDVESFVKGMVEEADNFTTDISSYIDRLKAWDTKVFPDDAYARKSIDTGGKVVTIHKSLDMYNTTIDKVIDGLSNRHIFTSGEKTKYFPDAKETWLGDFYVTADGNYIDTKIAIRYFMRRACVFLELVNALDQNDMQYGHRQWDDCLPMTENVLDFVDYYLEAIA